MTPCFLVDCHQRFGSENTVSLQILAFIYLTSIYTPLPVDQNLPLPLFFTRVEVRTVKFHIGQIFIQTKSGRISNALHRFVYVFIAVHPHLGSQKAEQFVLNNLAIIYSPCTIRQVDDCECVLYIGI
jgi:hypothetical protein